MLLHFLVSALSPNTQSYQLIHRRLYTFVHGSQCFGEQVCSYKTCWAWDKPKLAKQSIKVELVRIVNTIL